MLIGISSYTFPWAVSLEDSMPGKLQAAKNIIHFAAKKNISYVQFGDNLPLHIFSANEIEALKRTASDLHVNIQVGTKKLVVENITEYVSIATKFSSPFIRMVIDDIDYHPSEEEVTGVIHKILPRLRQSNIILAIENHDRFSAATLQRIISKTDPAFIKICLDTANSLGAGEGIEQVVKILAPYTVNMHVKDFKIQRVDHKMGFTVEGTAAGEGMLNIRWLVEELGKYDQCKTATLEIWSNPEETMEKTIMKEADWVEKSINYLKTIIV